MLNWSVLRMEKLVPRPVPLHHAGSCTHMNVTGDVYNDSQDVDTLLALFTFTDTTCSETQLV